MVLFEGMPYPLDLVYIRVAGNKEVLSLPFNEAMAILRNVEFDYQASKNSTGLFVIKGDTDKETGKIFKVTKQELILILQRDIYENQYKITDVIIQPNSELMTTEVKSFIGI